MDSNIKVVAPLQRGPEDEPGQKRQRGKHTGRDRGIDQRGWTEKRERQTGDRGKKLTQPDPSKPP